MCFFLSYALCFVLLTYKYFFCSCFPLAGDMAVAEKCTDVPKAPNLQFKGCSPGSPEAGRVYSGVV